MLLGGAGLASTFITLGLIDEYHLIVNPLVTGGR
ncbi:MAG: dihydrofolate reductase family protein [Betaproteobacteria bacterium]